MRRRNLFLVFLLSSGLVFVFYLLKDDISSLSQYNKAIYSQNYAPKYDLSDIAYDVKVKGHFRRDGTYVRPHHRSSPDNFKENNYGKPSTQQQKEWRNLPELPSYQNDYDKDKIPNRYDKDDDNDKIPDEYDSSPYGKQK